MRSLTWILGLGAAAAARPAVACGGFFCNTDAPIEQAAEQIAFGVHDGEVAVHVQIRYQGDPAEFAWILPLPAQPALESGTDELFEMLNQSALPRFVGRQREDPACFDEDEFEGEEAEAEAEGGESEGEGGYREDVAVEFRGAVGPYDAAVLASESGAAVRAWLEDNGYDVPDGSESILDDYVKGGFHILALRLLADRDAGDLQPIVARFRFDRPCIPLRLTAVAAVPDMPIRAWVFGDARAVPLDYLHVEPDWFKMNWLCGRDRYQTLVSAALDEAGGRAFVTEGAMPARDLRLGTLWRPGRYDLAPLAEAEDGYRFVIELLRSGLPLDERIASILDRHARLPGGRDFVSFLSEIACYRGSDEYEDDYEDGWESEPEVEPEGRVEIEPGYLCDRLGLYESDLREAAFDIPATVAEIDDTVVQPLVRAQEMIDRAAWLTVLYTRISPHEMTADPMFGFSGAHGSVELTRQVDYLETCTDRPGEWIGLLRVPFADGERNFYFRPADDFCAAPDPDAPVGSHARLMADLPEAAGVARMAEGDGAPVCELSNYDLIETLRREHNQAVFDVVGLPRRQPGSVVGRATSVCAADATPEGTAVPDDAEGLVGAPEGASVRGAERSACACRVGGGPPARVAAGLWIALAAGAARRARARRR